MDLKHLRNKGRRPRTNWYLNLPIPRPIRGSWPTKADYIVRPLGTGDLREAQRKRDELVVAYRRVFDRLKAGELMTQEQINAAVSFDWDQARAELYQALRRSSLPDAARHGGPIINFRMEPFFPIKTIEPDTGETISQAAAKWYERRKEAGIDPAGLEEHKRRYEIFIEHVGKDTPITAITRDKAADVLEAIKRDRKITPQTLNKYHATMSGIIELARDRGRFSDKNPFKGQRREVDKKKQRDARNPFTPEELRQILNSLPCDEAPIKHSARTALPWVARIAAFSGMRREEICQLTTADIIMEGTNGSTVTYFDLHERGKNSLKTDYSERRVPVHSHLVRAGLFEYAKGLPKGALFPGLKRNSEGELGAYIGKLFRDKLKSLGIKRPDLCFHSFRHTVEDLLRASENVKDSTRDALMGHKPQSIGDQVYSKAGLHLLKAAVEEIRYEGLRV
jgi:integrase